MDTQEPRYWPVTALAVIATALVVGGGVWWWMTSQLAVGEQPTSVEGWETYRNEEIGISFQYPGNLEPSVSTWDTNDGIITAGKSVEVSFSGEQIGFAAATSDFNGLYRFVYNGESLPGCGEMSDFSSRRMLCKETTVAGHKAVMKTEFLSPECSPSLPTRILLPHPNSESSFAGLQFSVLLDDAQDAVSSVFTCVETPTEAYQVAESQAHAILNNPEALSDSDAARLNLFKQIIGTVRFLE